MAMLRVRKKGQTTLEYIVLIIVAVGAFIAIGNYFKRGIQGRWKASVDELGDQYDPRVADSRLRHTLVSSSNTVIIIMNAVGGFWTKRTDDIVSTDTKTGNIQVGAY